LVDTEDHATTSENEGPIFARATGGIQDATLRGTQAQETMEKLMMGRRNGSPMGIIDGGINRIFLRFVQASFFFEPI
jgi:hypothetical protein